MRPADKRLAVLVPDHSIEYGKFEGTLAEGTYGAGEVRIWDVGDYETAADPVKQFESGKIVLSFFGAKLRGEFSLVRMRDNEENWLLIKSRDGHADDGWQIETVLPVRTEKKK